MRTYQTGTPRADCAVHLQQDLGAGLLETVYGVSLPRQFEKPGLAPEAQMQGGINRNVIGAL